MRLAGALRLLRCMRRVGGMRGMRRVGGMRGMRRVGGMHGMRTFALLAALAGCALPLVAPSEQLAAPAVQPEGASGTHGKPGWHLARAGVAAAHPLAAAAGMRMLREGGNALDAAIAAQMVLALVEPQSSGLGGGAFLLHWDGRELAAWDGRETAPAAAHERIFLQPDGRPLTFSEAASGGLAVGVPGAVRMLERAHKVHGRLPWAALFEPAIALAERGFPVGPRLHALLGRAPGLAADPQARAYFFAADGRPHPVGHLLANPALAAVLRAIAAGGSAALHEGPIAEDIVARVRGHAKRPGGLSAADLKGYAAERREPICTDWGRQHRVCGFPPPSSGHLTVMQILGLLQAQAEARAASAPPHPPELRDGLPGPDWLHLYAEASRLAFADRDQYIADPGFAAAPGGHWPAMLDRHYLAARAARIGERAGGRAAPGRPGAPAATPIAWAPMPPQPEGGTSHVSVVDGAGQAVALTSSIEAVFGARVMSDGGTGLAGGFLLNNQLTDFSFTPADASGRPVANRVQPGKRPRSSMSPTIVFDRRNGRLLMVLGSAGGAAIIHYTAKVLIGTAQWDLAAQAAIDVPNFAAFNGPALLLESDRFPASTIAALRERGHAVGETELTSGTHAIQRAGSGWHGAADPRREGVAAGE